MAPIHWFLVFALFLPPCARASGITPTPTASPIHSKAAGTGHAGGKGSFIWKKKSRIAPDPRTGGNPESLVYFPDPGYYDRLNAELAPSLTFRSPGPTHAEKVIETILGAASYTCAGVAGAQALGILPAGKMKKK